MKQFFYRAHFLLLAIIFFQLTQAQLTMPPDGNNKMAWVGERIGITDVTIHYNRPGVKGREGKIWGELVQTGFNDLGFGSSKSSPWRAGANENTTIEFSTDVMVEGKPLAAGKYGFFVAYDPSECTLIFSKNSNSWGSYFYDPKEDALRVNVKPQATNESAEWLRYEFTDEKPDAATISLVWEKLRIPFTVKVDLVKTQLTSIQNELRTDKGFKWENWDRAARWALQQNTNLEQALQWADSASGPIFGGADYFRTHYTKARILDKLGKSQEASEVMKKAIPLASMEDLDMYGRQLLSQKKNAEALDIFKMNYSKHPNEFLPLVGLTKGYSAIGDFKSALKYAKQALPLASPDTKSKVEQVIEQLKQGKDIN